MIVIYNLWPDVDFEGTTLLANSRTQAGATKFEKGEASWAISMLYQVDLGDVIILLTV